MNLSVYRELENFKSLLGQLSLNFNLVQGAGGNASVKTSSSMLVKASGKRMGSVSDPNYLHEISLENRLPVDNIGNQSTRPSIEVFLHALLEDTFVLHLHSTSGVAISMLAGGDHEIGAKLDELGITNLSYLRPGRELRAGIEEALEIRKSSAFLLGNHGTLFSANSLSDLKDKVFAFESWAETFLDYQRLTLISPDTPNTAISESQSDQAVWHALHNWRVSPDHVVFLGVEPNLAALSLLSSARTSHKIFEALGASEGHPSNQAEQLAWFFNVTQSLPRRVLTTLSLEEAQYLVSWEAEKHRVNGA
jgi:rhamnose utilization protein RhaD (predicted bifunctional aldolase and dehydrogenase)